MELLLNSFMLRTLEDSVYVCSLVEELVTVTNN